MIMSGNGEDGEKRLYTGGGDEMKEGWIGGMWI